MFNAIFATTVQRDLVLQYLIEISKITLALSKGEAGRRQSRRSNSFWPDSQRRRSYKIIFPRS